jgi:hypothetical protein
MLGQIGFKPFGKFTSCEHDASSAAFAFQPDIRAKTCDDPLIGATGVLLPKAEMIVEAQVR